jgi:xylan 1,4-beta-xylosidase
LANPAPNVLVTRRSDGTLVVATWNEVDPDRTGEARSVTLRFRNVRGAAPVVVRRVDATHGNVLPAYAAMGRPRYPTPAQVQQLNRASALVAPEKTSLRHGEIRMTVPINGLVVLELPLSAAARQSAR